MPSILMLHCVAVVRIDVPPKRPFLQEPHGVTSQKIAFFVVTAVKISDLAWQILDYNVVQQMSIDVTEEIIISIFMVDK
jgi:hypothetical protein